LFCQPWLAGDGEGRGGAILVGCCNLQHLSLMAREPEAQDVTVAEVRPRVLPVPHRGETGHRVFNFFDPLGQLGRCEAPTVLHRGGQRGGSAEGLVVGSWEVEKAEKIQV
jgi:hypothetical protein